MAARALSFAAFAVLPKRMNLLSISEETAASRGVDVHRTQRLAFLSASLATGAAVSLGGPPKVRKVNGAARVTAAARLRAARRVMRERVITVRVLRSCTFSLSDRRAAVY